MGMVYRALGIRVRAWASSLVTHFDRRSQSAGPATWDRVLEPSPRPCPSILYRGMLPLGEKNRTATHLTHTSVHFVSMK